MNRISRRINHVFRILALLFLVSTNLAVSWFQPAEVQAQAQTPNYLPIVGRETWYANTAGWPMVGGNSQRTSWTSEEVGGTVRLQWYRTIEAYIPQNAQLIAANGLIYVTTARGLYALDARNGGTAWRFDTNLPLGNSPTVDGEVLYVAGFDRQVHALNALTGQKLWSYSGAGAGYSTNPLVVEGKVILGNRDGYLYAIGAQGTAAAGQLLWRYQTGGPILVSAAYKNGVVYFASGDQYAYAVRTDGTLRWKSTQKLVGESVQGYWPVIYSDPTSGADRVIFSLALGYRNESAPGTRSLGCREYGGSVPNAVSCDTYRFIYEDIFYDNYLNESAIPGTQVSLSDSWAQGKTVYRYSRVAEYLEAGTANAYLHKPYRRLYAIFGADNGNEITIDSDGDGYPEYAPIVPYMTKSGNAYPPVAAPDGLLYFSNIYQNSWSGRVMGWRPGTAYFAVSPMAGAWDEPQSLSGGGKYIYRSICCDRVGDWFNRTNPAETNYAWHYSKSLDTQAPGYDDKWFLLDANFLERLTGNYANINGIYNNHGYQAPIIPYQGRLFAHRSNAIFAFGTQTTPTNPRVSTLTVAAASETVVAPTENALITRLESEVQKIISAPGYLRPGYYNAAQFNGVYGGLVDYFDNPADTVLALAQAYPYLSTTTKAQVKTYLQGYYSKYFSSGMYSHIGWAEGVGREAMILPPEVSNDLSNYPKLQAPGTYWAWTGYPQYNFYAMWKYAQNVAPTSALSIYNLAKTKISLPNTSALTDHFSRQPYELNGWISGYIGFLKLQELAGMTGTDSALRTSVTNSLNSLKQARINTFSKDTYYTNINQIYTFRTLNVSRNFLMMTPELGDFYQQNLLSQVQGALTEYNNVGPYWFVSRYEAAIAESGNANLYDTSGMFLAKAYILKQSQAELTRYLDAPAFERGDLFYIMNLVAAIQAP